MLYLQLCCMYIFKEGRDGHVFKVCILTEALVHVYQWPLFGELCTFVKAEWPANTNSDWLHHATFLTLDFIVEFGT